MNYLENICFLCLVHEQNVTSQGDIGSTIQEMLEYIVPEYALKKSEIPRNICDNCTSSLNNIFEFRQRCLKSIRIYNEYIQKLLDKNDKYPSIESNDILQNVKCEISLDIQYNFEQKEEEPNIHKELKIEILDEDYESSIRKNHSETSHIERSLNEESMIEDNNFQTNSTAFENSVQNVAGIDNAIPNEHFHSLDIQEDISLVEDKQDECITANDVLPGDANKSEFISPPCEMDIIKVGTTRGKDCIVLNNCKFRKARVLSNGDVSWRCTVRKCLCRVRTNSTVTDVLEIKKSHTHQGLDEATIEKIVVRDRCKKKAVEDFSARPSQIIHSALMDDASLTVQHGDVHHIRQAIYRFRKKIQRDSSTKQKASVATARSDPTD